MKTIYEISDLHYEMDMGCGGDVWRLYGYCPEHPAANSSGIISPSSPVDLDESELLMTTASGRVYKILSFEGDQRRIIDQIKSDIEKKGYEVH